MSYGLQVIKKMPKVSILGYNAGICTSEQQLSESLENSRCHTSHFNLLEPEFYI